MVERSTVVVDTVLSIHRNRLVTSSILVVRTFCFCRDRLACKPSTLRREQRRVAAANVRTPATHTCSYHTGAYPRNNRENCTLHSHYYGATYHDHHMLDWGLPSTVVLHLDNTNPCRMSWPHELTYMVFIVRGHGTDCHSTDHGPQLDKRSDRHR